MDGARQTSMVHALLEARGDESTWQRHGRKGGRSVLESSAVDAAVVQRAPVEHQTDLHFHAAACVEMELADALFSRDCG